MNFADSAPCFCGSAKRFDSCHKGPPSFTTLGPPAPPGPSTMVFEEATQKWRPAAEGPIAVTLGGMESADVRPQLEALQGEFLKIGGPHDQAWNTRLHDVTHKLYAVRRHVEEIHEYVVLGEKNSRDRDPIIGVGWHAKDVRIVFALEALLFQLKSTLDLLVLFLHAYVPPLKSLRGFNHKGEGATYRAGGRAIDLTRESDPALADLFETARLSWLQEVATWRDRIAHKSQLRDLDSFIQEPYHGNGTVVVRYPTMPSGMRVDVFALAVEALLQDLLKAVARHLQAAAGLAPRAGKQA